MFNSCFQYSFRIVNVCTILDQQCCDALVIWSNGLIFIFPLNAQNQTLWLPFSTATLNGVTPLLFSTLRFWLVINLWTFATFSIPKIKMNLAKMLWNEPFGPQNVIWKSVAKWITRTYRFEWLQGAVRYL